MQHFYVSPKIVKISSLIFWFKRIKHNLKYKFTPCLLRTGSMLLTAAMLTDISNFHGQPLIIRWTICSPVHRGILLYVAHSEKFHKTVRKKFATDLLSAFFEH